MNEPSIRVRNLTKSFGGRRVVDGLSFDVEKGQVFALLGHNGAGKSTTIDLILGLKTPESGTAKILGMDAARNRKQVFERVGVQLQHTQYQSAITVEEACIEYASLYAAPADFRQLLESFGLNELRKSFVSKLSGGERQKLYAGKRADIYCRLAADHDLHVLHRPHGGQPVPNHKIHECGDKPALFPHAAVFRGHYPRGGRSGCPPGRCRVDAPWCGDQAVEVRVHGML